MGARSKARRRAVDLLFEADLRGDDAAQLVVGRVGSTEVAPINDYTIALVQGVAAHQVRIDDLLSEHAEGWTLPRMPAVDRAILRVAVYELLWEADVPDAVAIDEALELAKALSTDDSPRFINGVLDSIARIATHLRAAL